MWTHKLDVRTSETIRGGWTLSSVAFKPLHFAEQLLQAGLELCADGVGLIPTCCAAAPHVRPLLRQGLWMLQEEAGYHLQTQKHTQRNTGQEEDDSAQSIPGKCNRFSTTSFCWLLEKCSIDYRRISEYLHDQTSGLDAYWMLIDVS